MNDLQKLQDMLLAMQQQRDQALNAVVAAQAEIAALRRTIAERDSTIKAITEKTERRPAGVAQAMPGLSNGHIPAR